MTDIISIDGSRGEGGGQIVRTALALSALLEKPFHVTGIRTGRKTPGLKNQHLHAIKAFEELCDAKTDGAALGSTELYFYPGKMKPGTLSIDIGTAGSITLLLQALLIPATLAGGRYRFKIKGGTDVSWSPQIDYLKEVIIPQFRRYADIDVRVDNRGYFPKGGGSLDITIKGKYTLADHSDAPRLTLTDQGTLMQVKGVSHAALELQKAEVAERQAHAAKVALRSLDCPISMASEYSRTLSTGSGITLWAVFSKNPDDIDVANPILLGSDVLGERGKRAEVVGEEAAAKLMGSIRNGAPVDAHLSDNLVPLVGVFGGEVRTSEISSHTQTNVDICNMFLDNCLVVDGNTIRNGYKE